MKKILQKLKTQRWIIGFIVILIVGLSVGGWQFFKYNRIMKKSDLEKLTKTIESSNQTIKDLQSSLSLANQSVQFATGRWRYWKDKYNNEPQTITETITEYVPTPYPTHDESKVANELKKLRQCIGSELWCW